MQLNIDNSKKPQFGMAIHSNPVANKAIRARIKNSADLEKLKKIIDREAKNDKVDITLMVNPDCKTISANAYKSEKYFFSEKNVFKQFSENSITRMFGGVVGFIEKVANYADKQAEKIKVNSDIDVDSVLNKITKDAE